jgi:ABC-2 type transport system ATP-binding protein
MNNTLGIETNNLCKVYGDRLAVNKLNLRVQTGGITAFLGRNGAGKSTTIKMLMGLVQSSSGAACILGLPINNRKQQCEVRRHIAYVSEDKSLYPYMTVGQIVRFTKSFYSDWRPDLEARLLKQFQLKRDQRVKSLSKGNRTKLALLLSLSRRPKLLILDEPTDGLDPVSVEELLQELVLAAADDTTVFFSSHQIADVERIADRVAILSQGRLAIDFCVDDLRSNYRRVTAGFSTDPPWDEFSPPGTISMFKDGRQVSLLADHDVDSVLAYVQSFKPVTLDVSPASLREVFLETVGQEER